MRVARGGTNLDLGNLDPKVDGGLVTKKGAKMESHTIICFSLEVFLNRKKACFKVSVAQMMENTSLSFLFWGDKLSKSERSRNIMDYHPPVGQVYHALQQDGNDNIVLGLQIAQKAANRDPGSANK